MWCECYCISNSVLASLFFLPVSLLVLQHRWVSAYHSFYIWLQNASYIHHIRRLNCGYFYIASIQKAWNGNKMNEYLAQSMFTSSKTLYNYSKQFAIEEAVQFQYSVTHYCNALLILTHGLRRPVWEPKLLIKKGGWGWVHLWPLSLCEN